MKNAKPMAVSPYPLLATTRLEHTVLYRASGGLVRSGVGEKSSILPLDCSVSLCLQLYCTVTISSAWNCYTQALVFLMLDWILYICVLVSCRLS